MKKTAALIIAAALATGCSGNWRPLDILGPERPMKAVGARKAADLVLFVGTVTGECRPFVATYADAPRTEVVVDPVSDRTRATVDRILAAKNVTEAEMAAADLRELAADVEALERLAATPRALGVHGGCVLPVAVAGDALAEDGQVKPRRVVCAAGEVESACKALAPMVRVAFEGRISDAGAVFYVPSGPDGIRP